MELLSKAPNVVATLNGHTHWNELASHGDIQCIQNAAFAEWPCMYRVSVSMQIGWNGKSGRQGTAA